jgi:hypothetical protein
LCSLIRHTGVIALKLRDWNPEREYLIFMVARAFHACITRYCSLKICPCASHNELVYAYISPKLSNNTFPGFFFFSCQQLQSEVEVANN